MAAKPGSSPSNRGRNDGRGGRPGGAPGGNKPGGGNPSRSHRPSPLPPDPEPHPPVFIAVPAPESNIRASLSEAMAADLVEVLGEFQIHPEHLAGDAAIARALGALDSELPVVIACADLLNPAPSLVEGMLEPLEEFSVVLVPGFSGECIAASLNPMAEWSRETVDLVIRSVEGGETDVGTLTQELVAAGGEVFCQMPWYRASDPQGQACCRAHMRALSASRDEDFLAHRTQAALDSAV